jgi:hypothetical protein
MKPFNTIKTTVSAFTLATAGLLAVGSVQAASCPLVPSDTASMEGFETGQLLKDGKFEQVEARLEKRHRKNLSSDGGDLLTLRDVYELLQISMRNENLVRMWADQRPQSFFSQFTAGIFYADQASFALGGRPMSQVGKSVLAQAQKFDQTAVGHLQKAMQLDARSALPHSLMLGIAARERQAGGKTPEQWLQAANQADPKNLAARINATIYLSPRWGGSFELLDQMTQQARKSLSSGGAHYLEYNVVLAKASHEEVIANNKPQAQTLYKRAKEMCDNSEKAQEGIVRTYR